MLLVNEALDLRPQDNAESDYFLSCCGQPLATDYTLFRGDWTWSMQVCRLCNRLNIVGKLYGFASMPALLSNIDRAPKAAECQA
jgi:hypothetical protein